MNFGVLIPIIALSIPIVAIIVNGMNKRREMDLAAGRVGTDSADSERMRSEIRDLKERIQVLERVITDSNSATALEREIEKLR